MKLENVTSVFNMGDTSLRVTQIVDVNLLVLNRLEEYMRSVKKWDKNPDAQEEFYKFFINEVARIEESSGIKLFSNLDRNTSKMNGRVGQRGRTLTNSLVKVGFIDPSRNISDVGKNYIHNNITAKDEIENLLGLSIDNIIYLRQYLKLKIYSSDGSNHYFYNFRFAIKFLSMFQDVPQTDFLKIIESIKPNFTSEKLYSIIQQYVQVSTNQQTFDEFYSSTFSESLCSKDELDKIKIMFKEKIFSNENFKLYFPNRKSSKTSLLYKDFVLSLISLVENKDIDSYKKVVELSRDTKIKKAFGNNKNPFKIKRNESVQEFLDNNSESKLLSADHIDIYLQFAISKQTDLIQEYSDMCRRFFQITGLISFENGLVNLTNDWMIKPLLEIIGDRFSLNGNDDYELYETSVTSSWYKDISLMNILDISIEEKNNLFNKIGEKFKVSDFELIPQKITTKREQEYRDFIDKHFPREKVIDILNCISTRDDEKVLKLVTDNANIPTIYEYILTIAWYHISEKKNFMLHNTFQVSLDGSKLPLTHRGGGAGDIEIITDDYALLIEATLMDMNTQKRGELEPVIRHSINYAIQNKVSIPSQSIFIANQLDDNVLNIFRATQFIQLKGTTESGDVAGLNIFALTTLEIIKILENDINDTKILLTINTHLNSVPVQIQNGWRTPIINAILT